MKKIICVLFLLVMLISATATSVFAGAFLVVENDEVKLPVASPKVDGIIEKDIYSAPAYLNELTSGYFWASNPLTANLEIYYAYDKDGIYFAADIHESKFIADVEYLSDNYPDTYFQFALDNCYYITNGEAATARYSDEDGNLFILGTYTEASLFQNGFVESTGIDDIESEGYTYGFNGDVFALSFDPCGNGSDSYKGIYDSGNNRNNSKAPQYLCAIVNGEAKIFKNVFTRRGSVNPDYSGLITDTAIAKVSAHTTSDGWLVEGFITWDEIIANIKIAYPSVNVTKTDILRENSIMRVGAMYMDRFYDIEGGKIETWGCFLPVKSDKTLGSGTDVGSMGIALNNGKCNIQMGNYKDTSYSAWYAKALENCSDKGYMNGMSSETFEPDTTLTREMLVTVLANYEGIEEQDGENFSDVPSNRWYSNAILWAKNNFITSGIEDNLFGLGQAVTREQLAAFLFNYRAYKKGSKPTFTECIEKYTDRDEISDWALDSINWCVYNKIICGMTENTLNPRENSTRAQAAQAMTQYEKKFDN